jgi:hypothetical protein
MAAENRERYRQLAGVVKVVSDELKEIAEDIRQFGLATAQQQRLMAKFWKAWGATSKY